MVGPCLCEMLKARALRVCTLGRTRGRHGNTILADLAQPEALRLNGQFDALVHMAPLWLLPENLERILASGVRRVIAFSSSSAESKQNSAEASDRELARVLVSAEDRIKEAAASSNIALTLFRPTMIYGFGRDGNIMAIAALIKRLGVFPIAGSGSGLRQPVHSLDLADAAIKCMETGSTIGQTYNLGGAEKLSYKNMVRRIFIALEREPRILHIPQPLYRALIGVAVKLRMIGEVSSGAAARMNEDLCFDMGPAATDFGYTGSGFLENTARDLPL